jgi:hypothetical protein
VLKSLWDATDVPDQERSHFVRMMSGPLRLHGASLEKVCTDRTCRGGGDRVLVGSRGR